LRVLEETRAATLQLVAHLEAPELERVHSPVMGPLVWDLAHIAAYEDVWLCHRHCRLELARPQLADLYDAFETPRALRSEARSGFLETRAAYAYMEEVHRRACQALVRCGTGDGEIFELVVRHELQHNETMRQTMNMAGLLPSGEPPALNAGIAGPAHADPGSPLPQRAELEEWLELEAGPFPMGAPPEGFAYDNERPRHTVELAPFAIAKHPLTNAAWAQFRDEGGYERRERWSEQGWAWLQSQRDRGRPPRYALRDEPGAYLCHINWFEAEALASANGARLPTEEEWEKAARASGLAEQGAPASATPGALAGVGRVWEWTSSIFSGFPGFRAHPYREYSEVFFDRGYRVLRGSSWATHKRVAGPSFRNWDLPEREQIFAGVRLARDT
jgi:iron(II)-dependent oxidoreductase